MTQVLIKIDDRALHDLVADCKFAPSELKRISRTAAWDTTKQTKSDISKRVRTDLNIKKKDFDPYLHGVRIGDGGKVSVKESRRIPLREFGAKDTQSRGVTYKIARNKPRGRIPNAFILGIAKRLGKPHDFGGHVFKRVGKSRLPIMQPKGVSLWGYFVKNNLLDPVAKKARENLMKNLIRRVRLEVLRRTGLVNTRNPFA